MLHQFRKQYNYSTLSEESVPKNPYDLFKKWMHEAIDAKEIEPNAMVISTVDENMQPHSRMVLLKDLSSQGLTFYSNYDSNKAAQILVNNRIAVLFFWPNLERQVRLTGSVSKIPESVSEEYFASRPVDSQLGAWSSPQSRTIRDYNMLKENAEKYRALFGAKIPKPPFWGGYLIIPETYEFWQGRPNRLHDRLYYSKSCSCEWEIERLAP